MATTATSQDKHYYVGYATTALCGSNSQLRTAYTQNVTCKKCLKVIKEHKIK